MKRPWAGLAKLRPGTVARAEDVFTACVRECAQYLAGRQEPPDRAETALISAIGVLIAEHTAHEPSADRSFDALLRVGRAAVAADEPRLAQRVGDTALAVRSKSKGAWRLRGEALEARGREADAVAAYERYLALSGSAGSAGAAGKTAASAASAGSPEVVRRLATLRERQRCLHEAARIAPDAELEQQPPERVRKALGGAVERRLAEHGAADPQTSRLAELYGTYCRLAGSGRVADPLLGGSRPIGVAALRAQVAGCSVCVVANGEGVANSGLGAEIDAYDVVIRLDSFQIRPADTGERTDIHAVSYRNSGAGWRRHARTRLVFGDSVPQWRQAIRTQLVPGAQEFVGDRSLSRPVRDPALLGEQRWATEPSTGFTVLRLLDFLDVSTRIDLIGFDQPGRLRDEERQWVMTHVRESGRRRMALR